MSKFLKYLGEAGINSLPLPGNMMPGGMPGMPGMGGGGGMMGMLDPLGLLGGGKQKVEDPNLQKMLADAIMGGINKR